MAKTINYSKDCKSVNQRFTDIIKQINFEIISGSLSLLYQREMKIQTV